MSRMKIRNSCGRFRVMSGYARLRAFRVLVDKKPF